MSEAREIIAKGRHNPRATPWVDQSGYYRFESYTYGIGRNVRINAELDAVIWPVGNGEQYSVSIGGEPVGRRFNKRSTAIAAAVKAGRKT